MINGNILIVDDNEEILEALKMFLGDHFTTVHARKNPLQALDCLEKESIDVFILDMNFSQGARSGKEGIKLMNAIRQIDPLAVILIITAAGDVELAITAIKKGANDFIQKPWNAQKLLATVKSAMELSKSRQKLETLRIQQRHLYKDQHKDHYMVYGNSRTMRKIMHTVDKVAGTAANVIIMGENGTGKELIAREIHLRSERKDEVFIRVDLGSLSESLFESELFGHVRGAFSEAHSDKTGRFELASGGSIFLNDVANITPSLQVKLLNVLENKEITKLGSYSPKTVDARIISATNMDLDKMVLENTFREDLLYRLNTIRIDLPPLRERLEDLPLLVDFFLKRLGAKYNKPAGINQGALRKLEKHHWAGNIRELQYTLEKAVILADQNILTERDFLFKTRLLPPEGAAMVDLKQNEKEIIKRAIQMNGGNLSQAARHLGISRRTLYNKISKYEI